MNGVNTKPNPQHVVGPALTFPSSYSDTSGGQITTLASSSSSSLRTVCSPPLCSIGSLHVSSAAAAAAAQSAAVAALNGQPASSSVITSSSRLALHHLQHDQLLPPCGESMKPPLVPPPMHSATGKPLTTPPGGEIMKTLHPVSSSGDSLKQLLPPNNNNDSLKSAQLAGGDKLKLSPSETSPRAVMPPPTSSGGIVNHRLTSPPPGTAGCDAGSDLAPGRRAVVSPGSTAASSGSSCRSRPGLSLSDDLSSCDEVKVSRSLVIC